MKAILGRTVISLLTLVVGSLPSATAANDDVSLGAAIYNQNCGRCHNPRPASTATEKEWSVIIPHMRVKAHLTLQEAMAVEAFLAVTLTGGRVGNPIEAASGTGADLITQFGCRGCHKIGDSGGVIGPELNDVIARRGKDFVVRKLREPTFNNPATAMPKFPLTEQNVEALVRYLDVPD